MDIANIVDKPGPACHKVVALLAKVYGIIMVTMLPAVLAFPDADSA